MKHKLVLNSQAMQIWTTQNYILCIVLTQRTSVIGRELVLSTWCGNFVHNSSTNCVFLGGNVSTLFFTAPSVGLLKGTVAAAFWSFLTCMSLCCCCLKNSECLLIMYCNYNVEFGQWEKQAGGLPMFDEACFLTVLHVLLV
jgi:hypothetical protein